MHRVGEEFVRSEVVYEPAKLYVKDIYRVSYECRACRKNGKVSRIKAGTPKPVIPHSYASPGALTQIITDKYVNCRIALYLIIFPQSLVIINEKGMTRNMILFKSYSLTCFLCYYL